MNGTYYSSPNFLNEEDDKKKEVINTGKKVIVYTSFDKIFTGRFEKISENFLIISNKNFYSIPISKINYLEFEEKIV